MINLTDKQLEVALPIRARRIQVFVSEGLNREDALMLADKLMRRDHDLDDRRICFECKNYDNKLKSCKAQKAKPLRFILQRCKDFILKGKK